MTTDAGETVIEQSKITIHQEDADALLKQVPEENQDKNKQTSVQKSENSARRGRKSSKDSKNDELKK